ncbi:unnamed protein product [Amoebophrya sp. A120]|nr:unnamed protein product [Amoebophrya sp. A120]|eukprot:GSA120T00023672001.1
MSTGSCRFCNALLRASHLFLIFVPHNFILQLAFAQEQLDASVQRMTPELQSVHPEGMQPIDGKLSGTIGAFFRYYNVYMKGPTEADETEAIRLADFARCDVCTTLLKTMLKRNFTDFEKVQLPVDGEDKNSTNSLDASTTASTSSLGENDEVTATDLEPQITDEFNPGLTPTDLRPFAKIASKRVTEDHLLDYMEGHRDPGTDRSMLAIKYKDGRDWNQTVNDGVQVQVLNKKVGCAKLFKDDFLYLGYNIRPCPEEERKTWPCVHPPTSVKEIPSDHAVNTYELWKDIVFFSCEQTIGSRRDEIARFILKQMKKLNIEHLAMMTCKHAAKCNRRLSAHIKPMDGGIGSENPHAKVGLKNTKKKNGGGGGGKKKKKGKGAKKKGGKEDL